MNGCLALVVVFLVIPVNTAGKHRWRPESHVGIRAVTAKGDKIGRFRSIKLSEDAAFFTEEMVN